jgi:hypothetical protein
LGNLEEDGMIILKWILEGIWWEDVAWLRIEASDRFL